MQEYVAKVGLLLTICCLARISSTLDIFHPFLSVLEASRGFSLLMSIPGQPLAVETLAKVHFLEERSEDFSRKIHAGCPEERQREHKRVNTD